jgi:hypothetical protein
MGRPRKNYVAEPTKIISFRLKHSVIKMLDDLAAIYSKHVRENVTRNEMIEILINGEMRHSMSNITKKDDET